MHDLAKRAVACKHWRWMPGMLAIGDTRIIGTWELGVETISGLMQIRDGRKPELLPDLTDPATLGCLLALVRERYRKGTSVIMDGDGRYYVMFISITVASGDSEAEALVSALDAR